jgi:hypothetical protein
MWPEGCEPLKELSNDEVEHLKVMIRDSRREDISTN